MSVPGLSCSFLAQSFQSPGHQPGTAVSSRQKEAESEVGGARKPGGESNSLWMLLVTPRKASFSCLKFQEMFRCLHCVMGWFQIGVRVETGPLGGWGNFPLLLGCGGLAAAGQREQSALISPLAPVIYPLCRFPLKTEKSGSLIKGACSSAL